MTNPQPLTEDVYAWTDDPVFAAVAMAVDDENARLERVARAICGAALALPTDCDEVNRKLVDYLPEAKAAIRAYPEPGEG